MSFTINLYTTTSDPRQVTKTINEIASNIPITPSSSVDILNPTLIIGYNENYLTANYCYIPDLSRYYYISNISLEIGNIITIQCTIDVLMSFAMEIRNIYATIIRSESIGKPTYVVDSQLPIIQGQYYITAQPFHTQPLNTDVLTNTVLITLGG